METIKNLVISVFLIWIMAGVSFIAFNPELYAMWSILYDNVYFNHEMGNCETCNITD